MSSDSPASASPAAARRLDQHLQQTLPHGRVAQTRPAGCPDLNLWLFDPQVLEGPLSHDEAQAVVDAPAYWSFCWASGQVLAAWILRHPEAVAGKRVLDFGCGSGIVAIAAARAGARDVIACDLDPAALDAAEANALANGVTVARCEDFFRRPAGIDVITAADVLYDPDNRPLLATFHDAAPTVLLADSRVRDLGDDRYQLKTVAEARTWPDLHEFEEFNRVRIYRCDSASSGAAS
ncbi:50S ribosomal protein L11 methyltransferase [Marinobacter xestospongiae]|uniref:50S ribosomal protein L11 methyltransferase n=1 Tax=Marinobacter xestospongiae TaxID=994319 RepID=UPI002004F8A0|nr:50S ribosomal protein L11 methyltransferase [Marinobacter xestospongiae]MCK7567405.1 50S ribosomal protein L11 methyltransferase [Marinobacter xestospongiae]